jgi:hypothetical protein
LRNSAKEKHNAIYQDVDVTNMTIQKKETVVQAKYENNVSQNYDPLKTV